MNYSSYSYIYPPRPEVKIPRSTLGFYEQRGYFAQVKKNGTCTVIFAKGNTVIFKTRHADDHKLWTPLPEHSAFFAGESDWNVYVAELLHSKTPHVKNQLYVFDQLVKDGKQLVGTTFGDRQKVLHAKWEKWSAESDQVRVGTYVSVAKCFSSGFDKLFDTLKPEDEGLVLKNPCAKLLPGYKSDSNSKWQVKCRVTHKNYSF